MTQADGAGSALSGYELRVREIAERAQAAREQLAKVRPEVTSPDGAVTVTVSAAGALAGLSFGPAAGELDLAELAASVLRTSRAARVRAAEQTQEALAGLIGPSGPAMDFLRAQLPSTDEDLPPARPATRPDFVGSTDLDDEDV